MFKVYEYILEKIRTDEDNNKRGAGEMVGVLMMHVDVFPNNVLIKLVNRFVEHVQNGSSLQGRYVEGECQTIVGENICQYQEYYLDHYHMSVSASLLLLLNVIVIDIIVALAIVAFSIVVKLRGFESIQQFF